MKKLLAITLSVMLLASLLTGCGGSDTPPATQATTPPTQATTPATEATTPPTQATTPPTQATTPPTQATTSSAFDKLLADNNIVWAPSLFFGMDSTAFAGMNTNGMLAIHEIGYEGSVVKTMITTQYGSIVGATEAEIMAYDTQLKKTLEPLTSNQNVTLSSKVSGNYYSYTLRIDHVEDAEMVALLQQVGLLQAGQQVKTVEGYRASYLSQGMVER